MMCELIKPSRSTCLRKNTSREINIVAPKEALEVMYVINGPLLIIEGVSKSNLRIKPLECYMIINSSKKKTIEIEYNTDIKNHEVIYDPYKYENLNKENLDKNELMSSFNIPNGYIDTLPKWYSLKFTYEDYNLIFIKPGMGLSLQRHKHRSENWRILSGNPIIVCGKTVNYNVEPGSEFEIKKKQVHTIINPNLTDYVLLEEKWTGNFDEKDIERMFNPNNYK